MTQIENHQKPIKNLHGRFNFSLQNPQKHSLDAPLSRAGAEAPDELCKEHQPATNNQEEKEKQQQQQHSIKVYKTDHNPQKRKLQRGVFTKGMQTNVSEWNAVTKN